MTILWTILPGVLAPRPLYVDVRSIARGLHWDLRKHREKQMTNFSCPKLLDTFHQYQNIREAGQTFSNPKKLNLEEHIYIYICIYIYVCITVYNNRANCIDMNIQDHLGTQSTHINDPGRSIPYPYRQVAMKALLTPGICPMTGKPSADPPGK